MKGNLAIGQSGGPTPVINATLAGLIQAAKDSACFEHVYGLQHGMEGALNGDMLDLCGLTDADLDRLAQTPGAALGSSRRVLDEGDYARVLANFQAHDVRCFAYIGGNGSMGVANHLAELAASAGYDLRVVGVPKTVDNDLPCIDHAPGYGSAARFLALATRDAGLDLEAMQTFDDVVILEAMGRDTGWLAAASGLLKESDDDAPHLIYVPEIPFDEQTFLADVKRVHARLGRCFVVISEGIRAADGRFVGQQDEEADRDALGRVIHGLSAGQAAYLTALVRERLGLQVRFFRPGLIGRSSSACVSDVDREEAYRVGEAAARLLAEGQGGVMVGLDRNLTPNPSPYDGEGLQTLPYSTHICSVSLSQVANGVKPLPRGYMDEAGTMITRAFREYALPLIGVVSPITRLHKTVMGAVQP